jgi:LPXTG-motif cell wall-anchored protein
MHRALAALILALALLAVPATALAQSAGDEQYVDPFEGEGNGGQVEQQAPEQEPQPAPAPEQPSEPVPSSDGQESPAQAAQETSPTLPRTGAPVVLFAAAGYALLLAGIAIRRKT